MSRQTRAGVVHQYLKASRRVEAALRELHEARAALENASNAIYEFDEQARTNGEPGIAENLVIYTLDGPLLFVFDTDGEGGHRFESVDFAEEHDEREE